MKTDIFDFELPEGRIALQPENPRDAARMLVVAGDLQDTCNTETDPALSRCSPQDVYLQDKKIRDLPSFLRAGDVMVFNDTKVIPARLFGLRGEAKIEILLHKKIANPVGGIAAAQDISNTKTDPALSRCSPQDVFWQCFAKPAKRLKVGDTIKFADDFSASVIQKLPDGQVLLQFVGSEEIFWQKLEKYGLMPLPPYIESGRAQSSCGEHRESAGSVSELSRSRAKHAVLPRDEVAYQTVYARQAGSVAAPTAGLHFTDELLAEIDKIGVKRVHITLHVGGGTFLPVKVEDTAEHIMHSEYAEVSKEAAKIINEAKKAGGRVIAVGTTSVRTLESASAENGELKEFADETNIFITPGYRFKIVDVTVTNFHLPKSTLFMLVCAFSGTEKMKAAYAHATRDNYRFYSYGDACLLFCHSE